MGFLDQISRTITQSVDRAKFEAEKFQRTTRMQGELNELKRQLDEKMIEMGQRAYELYRAGQITAPTIGDLSRMVDQLRTNVVVQEEELKKAQSDNYIEPPASTVSSQSVPVHYDSQPQPPPVAQAPAEASATKVCPTCNFEMPARAMFCPNCGARVG